MMAAAQQRPHYTQYMLNNYIVNPAISGIENYVDVKLSARNQWVGLEGAPRTFYLTAHAPIGKDDYRENISSLGMKGENPRGRAYWEEYTAAEPHHGVGMSVVNYKTGYINRLYFNASYAYHIGLSARTNLSAGFSAGFTTTQVDLSKIELANPLDPAIGSSTSAINKWSPDLAAGLWLYSAQYYVGISAQQIIPQKIDLVDPVYNESAMYPHLFLTGGYRFYLTEEINAVPAVMVRYIPSMPVFTDLSVKFQYLDRLWAGASWRSQDGLAIMAGLNISQTFNISYSYDFNNSEYMLSAFQKGTHEIVLGFQLNNVYGDLCPKRVW
jgi:type IX secretion system PorP/SprF family membrane protein